MPITREDAKLIAEMVVAQTAPHLTYCQLQEIAASLQARWLPLMPACRYAGMGTGRFWLEAMFVTQDGNWFLYSDATCKSREHVYCNEEGRVVTPFAKLNAFEWLTEHNAGGNIIEKYFSDKVASV